MGSINSATRFPLPDNLTQDYAIPYAFASGAIAVGVGDLCYWKDQIATYGDVAYPADQFTSLGNEALDQAAFASVFAGVSEQQILSTETNAYKRFVLRTGGPCDFKCPSQTWKHGDPVAIYSNGTALDPQQVDKPAGSAGVIGIVAKDYVNATTVVRVVLFPHMAGAVPPGGCTSYQLGALATDTVTNTASETAFATQAVIQPGTLDAGDVIHIRVAGVVTGQNSTNTNTIKLKIETAAATFTAVVSTGAINAAANAVFVIDVDLFITAVGASGSFYAVGDQAFGAQGTATRSPVYLGATAINTTLPITIEVTDAQSAASAGNVTQLLDLDVSQHRR